MKERGEHGWDDETEPEEKFRTEWEQTKGNVIM